jgi:hypothetical protein
MLTHRFAHDALVELGALIDPQGEDWIAALPAALAGELGLPDWLQISPAPLEKDGREGIISSVLGSTLIELLTERFRGHVPRSHLRADAEAPRPSQARALADRFSLRNAVGSVLDVTKGNARYLQLYLHWTAEADDRFEGIVRTAIEARDGSVPATTSVDAFDALGDRVVPDDAAEPGPGTESCSMAPRLCHAAQAAVTREVEGPRTVVRRRHERDYARIVEYFTALISDASSPKRRVERAAIDAKIRHLVAERDTKLLDLASRFTLRVAIHPAAIVFVEAPVALVRLRVRRRKTEREIVLRLPPEANAFDALACSGCPGATTRPAFCDDGAHVLCEICAPRADGRPDCPACRNR